MPLVVEMAGRVGAPEACFASGHTAARCKGVPETRSEPDREQMLEARNSTQTDMATMPGDKWLLLGN